MICETNSSCESFSDIVYNLSSMYSKNAPVHSLSTLPIAETMYIHSETDYALLERYDLHNVITKLPPKTIKFYTNVLCKKITLLNFPCGQYMLNLNGENCATARCENVTNSNIDYSFDFSQEQSKTLQKWINCAIDPTEPIIENREHYLNLSRIDGIRINSSTPFQDGVPYRIKLEGYSKIENMKWETTIGEKIIEIYPNSYQMNMNHPTDCIDFSLNKINILDNAQMMIRIDGEMYAHYTFNESNANIRIKCKNLPNKTFQKGAQNWLLSENINQNTINFSRINNVELILVNCTFSSVYQYRYMCYAYPARALRYCS